MATDEHLLLLIPDTYVCANGIIAGGTLRQYQQINRVRDEYTWVNPPVGCGTGCSCAKSIRGHWL